MNISNRKYPFGAVAALVIPLLVGSAPAFAQTPSTSQNFVVETTVRTPGIQNKNVLANLPVEQANRNIQYLDGLGRPLQTVQWQASPLKRDIVQPIAYDALGREVKKYLPYADIGTPDGGLRPAAMSSQASFYGTGSWDANIVRTAYPFSQTVLEASPLNRVLEQGAPGATWQPAGSRTASGGRTSVLEHGINTSADAVKLWSAVTGGASSAGNYPVGKLFKLKTKDENWTSGAGNMHTVDEYKDMEGRVVLKRAWQTASVALDTYYIYDDLGNLRYVVPPAVTVNSFTETDAVFDNYIYGYHYDGRKRNTRKHVPGKGWEEYVYNKLDQVVMSQDAKGKLAHGWIMNKYDALGRLIITGIYEDNISRDALQGSFNSCLVLWESRSGTADYTNLACPTSGVYTYLTVNYYDDYAFLGMGAVYPPSITPIGNAKGLLTGTKVFQTDGSAPIWTLYYYDEEGRVRETIGGNHLSGTDRIVNTYSFPGELTSSIRSHVVGSTTTTVANTYLYDHMGRRLGTTSNINGQPVATRLNKMDYNEVGQLKQKQLHSEDGGTSFLQGTKYAYNERGWLKNSSSPQFSMKLGYDTLSNAQYNGNISTQLWGPGYGNQFLYGYDGLNRLTSANSTGVVMGESLTYDVMGNIKTLNRDGTSGSYSYTGNRLNSISGGLATGVYAYDANGNATTDGRTGVTLGYNLLNLPTTATKPGLNLAYTYAANGSKLRKVSTTTGTTTTDYVGGIQYTDGAIDFIQTEEGLARRSGSEYSYEYNLIDHLGNVRYTFNRHPTTGALQELQKDDYYAFGKRFGTGVVNKYLYNGKELQEELGQYDYGARFYDPIVGRWNVVDPLGEKFYSDNPYNFTANNPINNIDPNGMETYSGDAARDFVIQMQGNLGYKQDGQDPGDSENNSITRSKKQMGKNEDDLLKYLTVDQRKQLEQIKSGTKLTVDFLKSNDLDKAIDKWLEKTAVGKNLKVGIVDYVGLGGEIFYDHKLKTFNGISKNEYLFRFVTKTSTTLISSHLGSLSGAAIGSKYGSMAGGAAGAIVGAGLAFYIENTYWKGVKFVDSYFQEFGNYVSKQVIINHQRGF